MAAFFCADLHLGHRNIHSYRPKPDGTAFLTPEEHDKFLVERWMEMRLKNRRDTVYVLGDIAFTDDAWDLFDSLPGKKIIILGNHCTESAGSIQKIASLKSVNSVHAALSYKGYWLTHIPMHPAELRGKRNIHGHMHAGYIRDRRFKCVSLEHTEMRPINLEEITAEFERRQSIKYVQETLGWQAAAKALMLGATGNTRKPSIT
jgi:calcineurin-like phosphoesterase family protein